MSGGSYNYLCWKDPESGGAEIPGLLNDMESGMRHDGYHEIADEIFKYRLEFETAIHRLQIMHKRLHEIMHAYEWWQSNDTSKESFDSAVEKFFQKSDEECES